MTERLKNIMIVFLEEILCIQNLPTFLINAKINYQVAKEIAINEVENKSKE